LVIVVGIVRTAVRDLNTEVTAVRSVVVPSVVV
jgi:hypothetical protein